MGQGWRSTREYKNKKETITARRYEQQRTIRAIEEVWRKKPRQTDVVVLWGKIATHTLLVADKLIKGGQGQKYGGIFVYYIFYYRWIDFPSNVLGHSGKYCNPIVLY